MNKKELVGLVRRSLLGREAQGDDQKAFHWQRVSQAVGYAFDTIVSQIPLDDKGKRKLESFYVKHYYNQTVKESNGYRYFGVSDEVISVGEGRGIWYVQPSKNLYAAGGGQILPSRRPSLAMFGSMAVGEVMNQTFWRFGNLNDNKQIILENIGNSPMRDIREVDFGVVRSFKSYSDTDQVVVDRMDLVIDMAKSWLSDKAFTDEANNNN